MFSGPEIDEMYAEVASGDRVDGHMSGMVSDTAGQPIGIALETIGYFLESWRDINAIPGYLVEAYGHIDRGLRRSVQQIHKTVCDLGRVAGL